MPPRVSLPLRLALGLILLLATAFAGAVNHANPGPVPAPAATPSAITNRAYVIKEGDAVKLTLYGAEDLPRWLNVNAAGCVVFPLVGQIKVGGLTVAAAEVTDISGRGYGMDVVKTNIEQLGGTVDLESAAGRGTVIIIRIPAQSPAKPTHRGHSAEAA